MSTTLMAHNTHVVSIFLFWRSEVWNRSTGLISLNSSRVQSIFSSIPASRKHLRPLACGSLPTASEPALSNLFLPVSLLHLYNVLPCAALEKLGANLMPELVVYVAWEIFRIWLFKPQWMCWGKILSLIMSIWEAFHTFQFWEML